MNPKLDMILESVLATLRAEWDCRNRHRQHAPTVLGFKGTAMIVGFIGSFQDDEEKQAYLNAARVALAVHGCDTYVFISEAWASRERVPLVEAALNPVAPSEQPDRREIIMLVGATRNGDTGARALEILPGRKLGAEIEGHPGSFFGRLFNLFGTQTTGN